MKDKYEKLKKGTKVKVVNVECQKDKQRKIEDADRYVGHTGIVLKDYGKEKHRIFIKFDDEKLDRFDKKVNDGILFNISEITIL